MSFNRNVMVAGVTAIFLAEALLASRAHAETLQFEGEDLVENREVSEGEISGQEMDRFGKGWRGGAQLFWRPKRPGARMELTIKVPQSGRYQLTIHFTKAPDYGIIDIGIDKKKIGSFDGFNPGQVIPSGPVAIGSRDLDAGVHTLIFVVSGKDPRSESFKVGIDAIELTPTDGQADKNASVVGSTPGKRPLSAALTPQAPVQVPGQAVTSEQIQQAAESFDDVFGDQLKRAKQSTDKSDDVELAEELLSVVRSGDESPAMTIVILKHVAQLGAVTRQGFDIAAEALDELTRQQPDKKDQWFEKLLALRKKQYFKSTPDHREQAGRDYLELMLEAAQNHVDAKQWDSAVALYREALTVAIRIAPDRRAEITAMRNDAMGRQRLIAKVEQLKKVILSSENDAVAKSAVKQLLDIFIVQLDDPAAAAEYAFMAEGDQAKANVKAAGMELADIDESQAEQLGLWYHDLSKSAPKQAKSAMLERAKMYFEKYLEMHGDQDIKGVAVRTVKLKSIDAELEKLNKTATPTRKPKPVQPRIAFLPQKRMKPDQPGAQRGGFPVQQTDDPLGPFVGKGVYFSQTTQEVFYEVLLRRRVRQLYWKGAASSNMRIEFLDLRGNLLGSAGPFNKGNTWSEHVVNIPPRAGTHFVLRFHNEAGSWYYIDTIRLK